MKLLTPLFDLSDLQIRDHGRWREGQGEGWHQTFLQLSRLARIPEIHV